MLGYVDAAFCQVFRVPLSGWAKLFCWILGSADEDSFFVLSMLVVFGNDCR